MAVEHRHITVSKRLVAINSISSLGAKIVNMTVLLWMYQYLLKRISAEEFAVLPVVTALMVFAPLFFSFFTGGISRYIIEAYAKGDFEKVGSIVSSIFPPLAAMGLVFLTGGLVFAAHIEKLLNIAPNMVGDARLMMALLIVSFALQMLAVPFAAGFHVRQRFVELNLLGIVRDLLRIVLLLVFLLGIGPQVVWVVVATVISEILHTAAGVWRSRVLVPELRLRWSAFDWHQARELLNFGLWTTIGRLGSVMYTNAATILLNLYGTAVDVTSYHIGATFFRQIDSAVALAAQPLQPALTAMYALEDRNRLAQTVFRGGRYGLWVALAVAVPLTIYAENFIALYLGDAYSRAGMVIVLFMVTFSVGKPTVLLAMAAMAMVQVRVFFLPAFLFQLAGLGLMAGVLRWTDLGAVGVTLSLAIITTISQIFYYWPLCLKLTGTRFRNFAEQVLLPGLAPALGGGVVWLGLGMISPPTSWTSLFAYSFVGGGVYLLILFGFCLNSSEKTDLRNILVRIGIA